MGHTASIRIQRKFTQVTAIAEEAMHNDEIEEADRLTLLQVYTCCDN